MDILLALFLILIVATSLLERLLYNRMRQRSSNADYPLYIKLSDLLAKVNQLMETPLFLNVVEDEQEVSYNAETHTLTVPRGWLHRRDYFGIAKAIGEVSKHRQGKWLRILESLSAKFSVLVLPVIILVLLLEFNDKQTLLIVLILLILIILFSGISSYLLGSQHTNEAYKILGANLDLDQKDTQEFLDVYKRERYSNWRRLTSWILWLLRFFSLRSLWQAWKKLRSGQN